MELGPREYLSQNHIIPDDRLEEFKDFLAKITQKLADLEGQEVGDEARELQLKIKTLKYQIAICQEIIEQEPVIFFDMSEKLGAKDRWTGWTEFKAAWDELEEKFGLQRQIKTESVVKYNLRLLFDQDFAELLAEGDDPEIE